MAVSSNFNAAYNVEHYDNLLAIHFKGHGPAGFVNSVSGQSDRYPENLSILVQDQSIGDVVSIDSKTGIITPQVSGGVNGVYCLDLNVRRGVHTLLTAVNKESCPMIYGSDTHPEPYSSYQIATFTQYK